ncbi:hypothetical protein DPMN_067635 [Dreissena polymorpha]|uniref:Uncharacterized protein n=1 Tax=Dreissena polymorpha TaxID=45954 RepID=A0A9D3Z132_DREPO|nr:hypothetical protein DPMN_067635 [Dreissena polymorpha]
MEKTGKMVHLGVAEEAVVVEVMVVVAVVAEVAVKEVVALVARGVAVAAIWTEKTGNMVHLDVAEVAVVEGVMVVEVVVEVVGAEEEVVADMVEVEEAMEVVAVLAGDRGVKAVVVAADTITEADTALVKAEKVEKVFLVSSQDKTARTANLGLMEGAEGEAKGLYNV